MKRSLRFACLIVILSLLATACGPNQQGNNDGNIGNQAAPHNQNRTDNPEQNRGFINNHKGNRTGNVQQERGQGNLIQQEHDEETDTDHIWGETKAPEAPNTTADTQKIADRLVKIAARLDEVNDATAVVAGRWAIVGIDVDAQLDRERVGSIKYTVAEALKSDPYGAYAIVTADLDTNYRLKQMAKEIRGGKPVEGFMEELAAIVGRIMPQIPRDIADPVREPNTRPEGAEQDSGEGEASELQRRDAAEDEEQQPQPREQERPSRDREVREQR